MKKNVVLIFLLILSFSILSCCDTFGERENYAHELIQKVEKFKNTNNRLPNDSSELGITENENSKAFYLKKTNAEFEIWYAIGFESMIYNSKTKKWREEG